MVSYGIDHILELLPHRYPFLLIDRVLEAADDGSRLVAIKNVTFNEPYFQGHFPNNPIMPGVLHIEAIAQACALMCLSATTEDVTGGANVYDTILTGVDAAKFRRIIRPGDQIRLETALVHRKGRFGKAHGTMSVDGKVATECDLSFMLIPHTADSPAVAKTAPAKA